MATAIAVWSLALEPGQTESIVPLGDLRITNVALGDALADENGRTSVKLVYIGPSDGGSDDDEDEEEDEDSPGSQEPVSTVLCSLTPGKIEQAVVDIILEGDQEYLFESVGKNVIYLTGNYIDQPQRDQPPFDDSDEDDAYDLRDVSSDVEVDPEEIDVDAPSDEDDADRFEEVQDEDEEEEPEAVPQKDSKKRPRESDADEAEPKLSKKERKKLKKLKAENGQAVPVGDEDREGIKEDKKDAKKDSAPKKPKLSETKELEGGVKIADHKVGDGPSVKPGDKVSVRYVGKLQNGKVFDSNTKGKPFQFRLGRGEVIQGWDIGVAGMKVGSERLITVPPAKGYGNKKQGGIPPNSTLTFEVKVVHIN